VYKNNTQFDNIQETKMKPPED